MAQSNFEERIDTYEIESTNVMTGDRDRSRYLYYQLKMSMAKAKQIDIIVSFLMESGVRMLLNDMKRALDRGVKIRILTGNYLGITQPSALYLIKSELGDRVDLRLYNETSRSFHPKSYIFHYESSNEIYIGSSNISKSALTSGIEWNYRFSDTLDKKNYELFYATFEDLFLNHSIIIDDEELNDKNTFKLLYTGGIRKSYNIKQILELAQKIQENNFENVKIFLYGNGNEKQEMIEYCKQNHIKNVVFRDFIDNKYIPDIMSKCDICLLHGKNVEIFKYGTSQNKMFAYLYSGKPIISSFYNKYDLIEKNGCGITLKNNTLEEYYEAFVKIYNTYNEKKYEYQKNERNLLEQFDYETLAKQLEKIIE